LSFKRFLSIVNRQQGGNNAGGIDEEKKALCQPSR
jgi:hypothetical protein